MELKELAKAQCLGFYLRGKKSFYNPKDYHQILIPINEVMEYSSVRSIVSERLKGFDPEKSNDLFYFWEIYILYRILKELKIGHKKITSSLNRESISFLDKFEDNKSFMDFLKGIKGSAGVKFDLSNPQIPTPDFYLSAENSELDPSGSPLPLIKIDTIKNDICDALKFHKSILYVLVDNLDDFASRENFDSQKMVIQGLVETCRYYTRFSEIKIKAALRPELYEKLNFAKLGGRDKIEPRTVHIKWGADDIRFFMGERIISNIEKHFIRKGRHLQIAVNETELYRPHKINVSIATRVKNYFLKALKIRKEFDIRDARKVDLKDHLYKSIITCIFPRTVKHYNNNGRIIENEDIFDYLENHFCFANNNATPRIYVRFLDIVSSVAHSRYCKNEPDPITIDENNEYPIIKRDFVLEAYSKLQAEARENAISSVDYEPWRKNIGIIFQKLGRKDSISFRTLKKWIGEEHDSRAKEFIAYCIHLGIFHCENKHSPLEQRKYIFPLLFQKNWG
ncbi:hypothetical protein [Marinobacter sp. F4218]|uniref:hypothetical protein n=1 Tax=Marinobacter sp. F4218 TaxID=2862868 RepID=UPI001C62815D|nr:hypothetical protein [Marinobacter sp. F4218]MBW7470886.1 hypothetical protein [Marinobacter sp. F4218]